MKQFIELLEIFGRIPRESGPVVVNHEFLTRQAQQSAHLVGVLTGAKLALLMDPVGTGKTVIALMAAHRLCQKGSVDRVHVVAPNSTVRGKWEKEARTLLPTSAGGVELFDFTTRHALDSIRPAKSSLFVIDEAHRGLQADTERQREIGLTMKGHRVLLVTATPFQLSTQGLVRMLNLHGEFKGGEHLEAYGRSVGDLLRRLQRFGDVRHESVQEGRKRVASAFITVAGVLRDLGPEPQPLPYADKLEGTNAVQATFINDLGADWLRAYHVARTIPAFVHSRDETPQAGGRDGDMFQRRLVSSTEAFINGQVGRAACGAEQPDALQNLMGILETRLGPEAGHPKVAATVDWVVERVRQRRHALIFTVFNDTQKAIHAALTARLGAAAEVHKPNSHAQVDKHFCLPVGHPEGSMKPIVLVVRDNLSEAVDLDGGHPVIVHHDLPWNPARLVQRWGRVVRAKSGFKPPAKADVFVPILNVAVDLRMANVISRRFTQMDCMLPVDAAQFESDEDLPVPLFGLIDEPESAGPPLAKPTTIVKPRRPGPPRTPK